MPGLAAIRGALSVGGSVFSSVVVRGVADGVTQSSVQLSTVSTAFLVAVFLAAQHLSQQHLSQQHLSQHASPRSGLVEMIRTDTYIHALVLRILSYVGELKPEPPRQFYGPKSQG